MNLLGLVFIVFVGSVMGLFSFQDSLIFYPVDANPRVFQHYQQHEIAVSSHGYQLQGWRFVNERSDNNNVVLYFGGNAEDVTLNFPNVNAFNARQVFFFNYRGYGNSQGKPSQQALYEDGLSIYDDLLKSHDVEPDRVIVMGRSLGSAVATYIAAHRSVARVILVTPFDSLENVAKGIFPLLPVSWIIKHPFPSLTYAPDIKVPALFLVAANDEVVPVKLSKNLYELWAGPKQWALLPGMTHNDIQAHPNYYSMVAAFVRGK